jgi:hypothetical protein
MIMCFSRHAVYLATFFMLLFSSPTLANRPWGPPPGCKNGEAKGNPQCGPAPSTTTETTDTHPPAPLSNQIGGAGGTSSPPAVPPPNPPQTPPQVATPSVPPGPRGRTGDRRPMPDNPDFTIQRGSGNRQRPGGSSNPPTVPPQTPPQVATPSVPPGPRGRTGDRRPMPSFGGKKKPIGHKLITRYPGRQPLHNLPQFESENPNRSVRCALSGYQRRRFIDVFGKESEAGTLPSLRNGGSIVRDIPAWHEPAANCLIVIKKRKHRKKLRPR